MKKRNKIYPLLIMIFLSTVIFSGIHAESTSKWKPSYYPDYTIEDFRDYAPANKELDFDNIDFPLLNAAVFYETNRMRLKNNRKEFRHSQALEDAAQMHSEDMVEGNFFSHYNTKDSSKRDFTDRLKMYGVDSGARDENIATAFGIQYESGTSVSSISDIPPHTYISYAEDLVDAWMHSPGHRRNILKKDFVYLGCGNFFFMERDEWPKFTATQNFGSIVPDDLYDSDIADIDDDDDDTGDDGEEYISPPFINVKYTYSDGYFMKTGDDSWMEKTGNDTNYYLQYAKDDVFYYLYDKSNNYYLALPIAGGMGYYYDFKKKSWLEFGVLEISLD